MNKHGNTLGAGDGIVQTIRKKRAPVASSRRFATRGISKDQAVTQKLKEALDGYQTPPETPMIKRSNTISEITPTKKSAPTPKHKMKSVGASANNLKIRDAGRRVCHQLMLNAWRRRKRQVNELNESRIRLQTQVDQLQMQVDVLQKLREAEGCRRSEATQESKSLKNLIENLQKEKEDLKQDIENLESKQEELQITIEKLNVDLMNEKNHAKTLANQKNFCEQAYNREKQQLLLFREERKKLIHKIEECERNIQSEIKNCSNLEEMVKMTELKYKETLGACSEWEDKCKKIESSLKQCQNEKAEVEGFLLNSKNRIEKLESKIHNLKSSLQINKQEQKKLLDDNDNLRRVFMDLEYSVEKQRCKPWWKCTGEFMIDSFQNIAYLLFPAVPQPQVDDVVITYSIGLGTL